MIKYILLACALFLNTVLQADYIIKYSMDGSDITFLYKDATTSKLTSTDEDGGKVEIYNLNKNSYIVSDTEDGIAIINVNELKAKAKKMKAQAIKMGMDPSMFEQQQQYEPEFKIKKTGRKEKVAGINGDVWILYGDDGGEKFEEKVTVTNNKRVVKVIKSMLKSFSSMSGVGNNTNNFFEPKKGYFFIKAEGMKLESFQNKKLSAKIYRLPKLSDKTSMLEKSRQKKAKEDAKAEKIRKVTEQEDKKTHFDNSSPQSSDEQLMKEATKIFKSFF